jgi:hypothetical protein
MSAQLIPFPRRATVINKLKEAEAELQRVVEEEEDGEAASDLWGVIERLQEIILKIQSPL